MSAETISRHDLIPVLRQIATERGEVSANRARSALSGLFAWAIEHGQLRRETTPTLHLPKWQERSRERVLSLEELAAVWRAAGEVREPARSIIRLLILTGCRRSEIAGLLWHEVDLQKALVTIPGSQDQERAGPHDPAGRKPAVAILEGVQRFSRHAGVSVASDGVTLGRPWTSGCRWRPGRFTTSGGPADRCGSTASTGSDSTPTCAS